LYEKSINHGIKKRRKAKEDKARKEHQYEAVSDPIKWNEEGIQGTGIKSFYSSNVGVIFEHMNTDPHQKVGEGHEDLSREGDNSIRSDVHIDGYSGPRARMVLNAKDSRDDISIPSSSDDSRLGVFERIVMAGLGVLTMTAVMASLVVVPFAILSYYIYIPISSLIKFMSSERSQSRFVILGTTGSYIIKDVVTREFVAKNVSSIKSAKKILKIFESDKSTMEG